MITYCKDCTEKHPLPDTFNYIHSGTCEHCGKSNTFCFFTGTASWLKRKETNKYTGIMITLLQSVVNACKKYKVDFNKTLSKVT